MKLVRHLVAVTLLPVILAACTNSVSFSVAPAIVCPGGTVTLRWDTMGAPAEITPGIGSVSASGSQTTTVSTDTYFLLRVNGTETQAFVNVIGVPPEAFTLNLDPVCNGDRFSGRWTGKIEGMPTEATVASVTYTPNPHINLTHDGVTSPNISFDNFTWTHRTASGPWDAIAIDPSAYSCAGLVGSSGNPAPHLSATVTATCSP